MNYRELKRMRKQLNQEIHTNERELKRIEAKIVQTKRKGAEWYRRASLEALHGKDGQTRLDSLEISSRLSPED